MIHTYGVFIVWFCDYIVCLPYFALNFSREQVAGEQWIRYMEDVSPLLKGSHSRRNSHEEALDAYRPTYLGTNRFTAC